MHKGAASTLAATFGADSIRQEWDKSGRPSVNQGKETFAHGSKTQTTRIEEIRTFLTLSNDQSPDRETNQEQNSRKPQRLKEVLWLKSLVVNPGLDELNCQSANHRQ